MSYANRDFQYFHFWHVSNGSTKKLSHIDWKFRCGIKLLLMKNLPYSEGVIILYRRCVYTPNNIEEPGIHQERLFWTMCVTTCIINQPK